MKEEKKVAIIPDTNFIREHPFDFEEVLKVLKKHGDVFMCEITIEEKLAQERIEINRDYEKINEIKSSHKDKVDINFKQTLEERIKWREDLTINNYKKSIGNNIIKFNKDEKVFSWVLERAYNKIPPFSQSNHSYKNPSDKGFKDTLLWFSLLEYFSKEEKYSEIILITNDKGFLNNSDFLSQEFEKRTGKKIKIQGSEFYRNLISNKKAVKSDKDTIEAEVADMELQDLRNRINNAIINICSVWDDEKGQERDVFTIKFSGIKDNELLKYFEKMEEIIKKNIFNQYVSAKDFWGDIVEHVYYNIKIEKYIELNTLYKTIKSNYANYLSQFFYTVATVFNNYTAELPF